MEKIIIKGERCTGTNYMYKLIEKNFGNDYLMDLGWKHSYLNIFDPELHNSKNYLVIFIFRNPIDWISSFYNQAWHFDTTQYSNISEFIKKEPVQINEGFTELSQFPKSNELFYERHPFTLDRPKNLCELRNWKNENFLNTSKILPNVMYVRYEDLYQDPKKILDDINGKYFNLTYNFENITTYKGVTNSNFLPKDTELNFTPKKYEQLSNDDLNFVKNNINWTIEEKIGYTISDIK